MAGLRGSDEGQFVNHVGQPLALALPRHVGSPQGVLQRFAAHADLGGQGLFVEEHQRAADGEVLREFVVEVHAEHRLALHAVVVVGLYGGTDVGAGVDDALVDDGDDAHVVVDGVVGVFGQRHTTGSHHHRTLGYVGGSEVYLAAVRTFVLARQQELVVFGYLLGHGLRAVVEFGEAVAFGRLVVAYPSAQMFAEGLSHGEVDAALVDGVAFYEVELSVGVCLVVIVQSVQVHGLQQGGALQCGFGQIGDVHAAGVGEELDVEFELFLRHAGGAQTVDVLHHQSPSGQLRTAARGLQHLHVEGLGVVVDVGTEFAHLIGLAAVFVLEGDAQDIVGLQRAVQRYVAQRRVQVVFRRGEQARTLQFLVVVAAHHAIVVEQRRGLTDFACAGQFVHEGLVLGVSLVRGHRHRTAAPKTLVADVRILAQVGKGNDVAVVGGGRRLIGNPYLHASDGDAAGYRRQGLHVFVVLLAEVVGEEEVAVLLVVGGRELEGVGGRTALRGYALRGRLLLADHGLHLQSTKLNVGAQTEQTADTGHQAVVGGHADVTGLHQFDDFVLLAVVLQFQALRVEIHRGIGVVVQLQVYLVAYATGQAQVYLFVEVEARHFAAIGGQRGVVHLLGIHAQLQFHRTLGLNLHTAGAEYLFGRSQVELHVGEVELRLTLRLEEFGVAVAEVSRHALLQGPVLVFVRTHQQGRGQIVVRQPQLRLRAGCVAQSAGRTRAGDIGGIAALVAVRL